MLNDFHESCIMYAHSVNYCTLGTTFNQLQGTVSESTWFLHQLSPQGEERERRRWLVAILKFQHLFNLSFIVL